MDSVWGEVFFPRPGAATPNLWVLGISVGFFAGPDAKPFVL